MKVLLAGWFSFEQMGATAGDLLCRDHAHNWLHDAGVDHQVAVAHPFTDGVDWRTLNPSEYTHLIFVCGPFGNGPPVDEMLEAFAHCTMVGLNLSMLQNLDEWDPFELLIERDSSRTTNPDMVFLTEQPPVPVIGVVLVHPQGEYGDRGMHQEANELIERVLSKREASLVRIDTRLDENSTGLRTPGEVESLIARMDAVITTRLHGLVMAIKNGVPAVAVDPIRGGAKIIRQAESIGWPYVLAAESADEVRLHEWLDLCLRDGARDEARTCAGLAAKQINDIHARLMRVLTDPEN